MSCIHEESLYICVTVCIYLYVYAHQSGESIDVTLLTAIKSLCLVHFAAVKITCHQTKTVLFLSWSTGSLTGSFGFVIFHDGYHSAHCMVADHVHPVMAPVLQGVQNY